MPKKERTPTRTAVEKYDEEEGKAIYGVWGWLQSVLKSQEPHDSSRNLRNREKDKKYKKKERKND